MNASAADRDAIPFLQAQQARTRLRLQLRPQEADARSALRERMALELQRAPVVGGHWAASRRSR